jgi:lysophospholipase L1-like esterase
MAAGIMSFFSGCAGRAGADNTAVKSDKPAADEEVFLPGDYSQEDKSDAEEEQSAENNENSVAEVPQIQPESEAETTTEKPAETVVTDVTDEKPSETAPAPPVTEPTLPPPTEPLTEYTFDPNNLAADDYMAKMFENAIEIVIDGEPPKSITVEQPPPGRSLSLQAKITPISNPVDNPREYFKNIIFLGDSVTTGFDLFREYITFNGEKVMADTTVIATKSYGVYNAAREISDKSVHPLYNGSQAMPEDIIAEKEGSKIFICLGLNDVSYKNPQTFMQRYADLINRIRKKSPNKKVFIMSVTPLTYNGQKETLNNKMIMEFNNTLIEFAAYNNIAFIDYAAALRDAGNHLYPNLSSDNYCHIVLGAYNRLIEYLVYHAVN